MKAHLAVYELRIVRSLASLLDAKALMSNRKRGTLSMDDAISNDDSRKR